MTIKPAHRAHLSAYTIEQLTAPDGEMLNWSVRMTRGVVCLRPKDSDDLDDAEYWYRGIEFEQHTDTATGYYGRWRSHACGWHNDMGEMKAAIDAHLAAKRG